jgi:hypothetical protein
VTTRPGERRNMSTEPSLLNSKVTLPVPKMYLINNEIAELVLQRVMIRSGNLAREIKKRTG